MAVQTGRTVSKFTQFHIGNSGNAAIRWIPVDSISALGHTYDETDLTAWMDAVKGSLPNMPDAPVDIGGPFDTTADSANDTALSGSHTILSAIAGAMTPLTLDVRIGIRHAWETGEPNFGISATATSGYLCTAYNVDLGAGKYSASFRLFPGSSLPAFGSSDETT
jgi:hypothetical protein